MRVAIVGCRQWDYDARRSVLNYVVSHTDGLDVIVTGDSTGVDYYAKEIGEELDIEVVVHKADWNTHGKAAGPIRNSKIVEDCDYLVAFWDGRSRGTLDSISKAVVAGKHVEIYPVKGGR